MSQIGLHVKIEELITSGPRGAKIKDIAAVISANDDARQFFFSKTNEQWLKWLWKNGFLNAIKRKAENPHSYSFRTPELNYLAKMAEIIPTKVVDIMLKVPISKGTFNPEVIDQFLRICSELPADQLARVANKILDENWVPLMGLFNQWGFEFEKMFKTLSDAKNFDELLVLAEAVLSVRSKEAINKSPGRGISENPFYFNELSYTKVFKYLTGVDNNHLEQALRLITQVFAEVINSLGKEPSKKEKSAFQIYDNFILADVDFFTLELREKEGASPREDIRELSATIKALTDKLIGGQCGKPQKVREIFKEHLDVLPDCQAAWRLKLYALSLCPVVFKVDLKESLFAIFKTYNYPNLTAGAEYGKTLKKCFAILSKADQHEYIRKALELFADTSGDEKEQEYRKYRGSRIFSVLEKYLTKVDREVILKAGFQIESDYKPTPIIGPTTGGTVAPHGPIPQDDFDAMTVQEIAEKLRTVWSPKELDKKNTHKDFLSPLNAEGAGDQLQASMTKRLQDFIDNAGLFFDRDKLEPHYTYTFLRGIENEIKNNKEITQNINWRNLVSLLVSIKNSGEAKLFTKTKQREERYSSWLADWDAVHSMAATTIEELLREWNGETVLNLSKYRDEIYSVIDYLFRHPDPEPEDEQPKTATMTRTSPGQKPLVTEPYMMAINSVRGKTFEAFIHFVYQDGKRFKQGGKVQIAPDVKDLYAKVLDREETKAIIFMFGRYLATFYYRDAKWVHDLLPKIFPTSESRKLLYIAAWEGYISDNLFKEVFEDPEFQKLYKRGLALRKSMDPVREFFKDPEKGIAVHLALAYAHYKNFGFDHPLFRLFWAEGTEKQHSEFIGFIGRKYLSKEGGEETIKNEAEIKRRFEKLWDSILGNYKHSKSLAEFGYWTRSESEIFEPTWLANHIKRTLEITNGELEWDYGLQKTIVKLAEANPEDTLEIIRMSLLEYGVRKAKKHRPIFFETEWSLALAILYQNQNTKDGTYKLIDDLIREGGSPFWVLKEIVGTQTTTYS